MRILIQRSFMAILALVLILPLNSKAAFVSSSSEEKAVSENKVAEKKELKISKNVTTEEVEEFLGRKMTGMEKLAFKLNKKKLTKALNAPSYGERTNAWAIVGFITSLFFGPLGIVFSLIALKQIRERDEKGYGLAIAGLVLGVIGTILLVAALL